MNTIQQHSSQNKRIDSIDYIRGFALLGILFVNFFDIIPSMLLSIPNTHDGSYNYHIFLYLFVENRCMVIFSFLFGLGFYIFITNAISRGDNGFLVFLRRLFILFIIGYLHSLLYSGEVLRFYAVYGLILLPFYKAKKNITLTFSLLGLVFCAILGAAAKPLIPIPLMLLGLAAGQYRLFEKKPIKITSGFTTLIFILSLVGLYYQFIHIPSKPFPFNDYSLAHLNNILRNPFSFHDAPEASLFLDIGLRVGLLVATFYTGILILCLQFEFVRKLLFPLKYYGRMALTNYIGQTISIIVAGHVYDFTASGDHIKMLYTCIIIIVLQFTFSILWLHFFKFGPIEWIWRMCTYGKITSLRK